MRNLRVTTGVLAMAFLALTVMSCKDSKKEQSNDEGSHTEMSAFENNSEMNHDNSDGHHDDEEKMYACSMHPDVIGKKGEKCSKCGMKLTEEVKKAHDNSDGHHDGESKKMAMKGNGASQAILNGYFNLKNALVADDNAKAKNLGATLAKSLGNLDVSNYTDAQKADLKDIIEDAVEHAEHISESDIDHQREHFKILSKDVTDMVAITGTENTLYEQFCPMYDGGSAWLSMNEEVKNPYYGSKMLKCGKVQKEIK